MAAYRIDKDLTISRVEGEPAEIIHQDWEWDCVAYDGENDIWCNDTGIFEEDLVMAWIGEAIRVPLPAFILGRYPGGYGDPRLEINCVQYGQMSDPHPWLEPR